MIRAGRDSEVKEGQLEAFALQRTISPVVFANSWGLKDLPESRRIPMRSLFHSLLLFAITLVYVGGPRVTVDVEHSHHVHSDHGHRHGEPVPDDDHHSHDHGHSHDHEPCPSP